MSSKKRQERSQQDGSLKLTMDGNIAELLFAYLQQRVFLMWAITITVNVPKRTKNTLYGDIGKTNLWQFVL
jgi:hypothetical protein